MNGVMCSGLKIYKKKCRKNIYYKSFFLHKAHNNL
jgi:hypothetical protein